MNTKYKVLFIVIIAVVSYAVGRYGQPEKLKETTKSDSQEIKKVADKQQVVTSKHKETKREISVTPDGTKKDITTITEDSHFKSNDEQLTVNKSKKTEESSKEITNSKNKLTIAGLVGTNVLHLRELTTIYGAAVSKEFIGPISLGAFGLTNGVIGVSLGVNL